MPSPPAPPPLLLFALGLVAGLLAGPSAVWATLLLAAWPLGRRGRPPLAGLVAGVLLSLPATAPGPRTASPDARSSALYRIDAEVLAATPPGPRGVEVRVRTSRVVGAPLRLRARIRTDRPGTWRPRPGQQVRLVARVRPPRRATNPGAYDATRATARYRTDLEGWLVPGHDVEVRCRAPLHAALLSDLRAAAARRFDRVLQPQDSALARALVLGDRSHLAGATRRRFDQTGQSHILAVSGLHVGLLLAGALALARLARVGIRCSWLIGILVLAVYVPIAGAPPSAVRAGVGAGLYLLGRWLGRTPSPFTLLAGVVVVVLVVQPAAIHEGGLRLSLAAVLGILLLTPRLQTRLIPDDVHLPGIVERPRAPVRRLLAVSLGAWLGVAPLLVVAFGRLAPAAPLLSIVTVPLAMGLVATAFLTLALGPVPLVGDLCAGAFSLGHDALDEVLRLALEAGLGALPMHGPGSAWMSLYGLALLAAGLAPTRVAWLGGALLPVLLLLACGLPGRSGVPHPRVTLFDVGHGQAALLELPDGRVALLDCGRLGAAEPGRRIVAPALRALGIGDLDLATASHADADHVTGFLSVHARHPIRRMVVSPGFPAPLRGDWEAAGMHVRVAARGRVLLAGRWGRLVVLQPTRALAEGATSNDRSLVLRLEVPTSGALILPGDIGARAVEAVLARPAELPADVLVLPHHGLPAPKADALRAAVGAGRLLASCGRNALATLPPGTWSTARFGALQVDFPPGGPVVTAPYAERAAQYDPAHPMPPLPALPSVAPWVLLALLLAFAFVAVRPLGWLTPPASAAAWTLGTAAALAFGPTGVVALFAPFVVATSLGKLPGARREGARRLVQVVANGAAPFAGAVLALAGHPHAGAAVYLGGLSALGADTCATEIGVRFGGTPRHVLTGRRMPSGESGGVTALGLAASVGGALLAPLAWAAFTGMGHQPLALIAFAGVAAGLVDSVLGATLQYRGTDPETGRVTEARRTEAGATVRVSGIAWLDNDGVNLLAGVVGAVLAWGLLGWLA